jgi:DNA excision repair protein ERCC-2
MIKNSKYTQFFPYNSFRLEQENIIDTIEQSVRQKKNILLVAPNGTGKTIIALSALLPVAIEKNLKIIYMCRTHSQSDRVIKELKNIHHNCPKGKDTVFGLSIRGRNEMCLNNSLLRLKASPSEAMAICKSLRAGKNCPFYRNLRTTSEGFKNLELFNLTEPVNAQELIKFCKEKRYCPYFLSKRLIREIPIVVCNFQWVFNPDIRYRFFKLLDTTLDKCILVIDECHNIIDVATEVNSKKLIPYFLTQCLNDMHDLRLSEKFFRFVNYLKDLLAQKVHELAGEHAIDADDFLVKLCRRLKLKDESEFPAFLTNLLNEYETKKESRKKSQKDEVSRDNIKYFVKFWMKWSEQCDSAKYFFCNNIKKSGSRKFIALEIVALDPRDITLPIFKKSYACLNLTGTVNPNVFKHLTGLNWKKEGYTEIIAQSPFKSRNILALITEGVNTAGANRNINMYKKIISKIEEVVAHTPANIGIFCASYTILKGIIDQYLTPNLESIIRRYGKEVFTEDSGISASDNSKKLQNFKKASKGKGAVLIGVCGGRNSEGEDYPGDYMNAVIIVGIPYHLSTPRIEAKIKYYDKEFHKKGWMFAYLNPAMQRANQASGRPIRKESDKGVIVFMDERFKDKMSWISEWVRKEIKIDTNLKGLVRRFWNEII